MSRRRAVALAKSESDSECESEDSSDSGSDAFEIPITVKMNGNGEVKVSHHVMEQFATFLQRVARAFRLDPLFKLALRDDKEKHRRVTRYNAWWVRQQGVIEVYEATRPEDDCGQSFANVMEAHLQLQD